MAACMSGWQRHGMAGTSTMARAYKQRRGNNTPASEGNFYHGTLRLGPSLRMADGKRASKARPEIFKKLHRHRGLARFYSCS